MANGHLPPTLAALMRTENDTVADASEVPPSTIKVVIIYEDFAAGARAKDFAERLAEALSCAGDPALSIWRSELLDCPPIGGQAARDAANCDYLIVSLCGDHALSYGTRHWIEMQLGGVSDRGISLVLLAGAHLSTDGRAHQYARYFFRSVCAENGVPFFCHATTPAPDEDAADFLEAPEEDGCEPIADAGGWNCGEKPVGAVTMAAQSVVKYAGCVAGTSRRWVE